MKTGRTQEEIAQDLPAKEENQARERKQRSRIEAHARESAGRESSSYAGVTCR